MDEYYFDEGRMMRLAQQSYMTTHEFQDALINTKTLRGRLAICMKKLAETGAFSDAPPEVWQIRQESYEHLPEGLKNGNSKD